MAFFENKLLIALAGFTVFYLVYRLFFSVDKADKIYKETVENIMTSEEYKVKGRFE